MADTKIVYGARIDNKQLNIFFMFFGIHPWSWIDKSSEELLAMIELEEKK